MKRRVSISLPSRGPSGGRLSYAVDVEDGATLLDALELIAEGEGTDICYRHSCHHGSCGTCGALVDGAETLLCLARVADYPRDAFELDPLRKAGVIAGIAVFPGELFSSISSGSSYRRSSGRGEGERFEDCIECGLCLSACPVQGDFRGPAGLAALARDLETRPERRREDLDLASQPDGVSACERHIACSRACPQGVAPARKIAELRSKI
jgi:succinate dehydrogenase/fumarate reductase iron-sulfur protein